jgi:parvulin-like peptidyl-prolyl isomerase
MRGIWKAIFGGMTLAMALCGQTAERATEAKPPRLSELFGDDLLARGKGVEVRSSQLEEAIVSLKANLAARGEAIPENQRNLREAQLLDRLIITQLLTNRVTEVDRDTAQQLAEKYLAETKKGVTSEEAFQSQLKALGLSQERFKRRLMEQALADAVVQRELRSHIQVTDAQVRDFYSTGADLVVKTMQADLDKLVKDPKGSPKEVAELSQEIERVKKANLIRLERPEQVRVVHVFLTTRDRDKEQDLPEETRKQKRHQIEKIRERALAGEDFSKLAMEFSEDRSIKETKGEYTFSRSDPFAEEFKAASFSLEPGKISDVTVTPFGYHVIKLLEKIPAQKIEFEKIGKDLKEFLTHQQVLKAMPDFFDKLKKEASVQILDPKYRIETSRAAESGR